MQSTKMVTPTRNDADGVASANHMNVVQLDDGLTLTYASIYHALQQPRQSSVSSSRRSSASPPPLARKTSPAVCYVIASATSALWTVLTVIATALVGLAILTPRWLVIDVPTVNGAGGLARVSSETMSSSSSSSGRSSSPADDDSISLRRQRHQNPTTVRRTRAAIHPINLTLTRPRTTSIGIFNECTERRAGDGGLSLDSHVISDRSPSSGGVIDGLLMLRSPECDTYVTGFDMPDDEFPDAWKSAVILLVVAGALLTFTSVTAVVSVCVQSLFGKSIFTVSGLIQGIAALLMVIGQLLYTAGWTSHRVRDFCGVYAGPFVLDECQIGGSFYCCMTATLLLFICPLLSIRAEDATSTDEVEQLILHGSHIVCVP